MDEKDKPIEQETTEEPKEEKKTKIDEANEAAEKMKTENDRKEELLEREEALKAEAIVSGSSKAGEEPKVETETERIDREAREIVENTGL